MNIPTKHDLKIAQDALDAARPFANNHALHHAQDKMQYLIWNVRDLVCSQKEAWDAVGHYVELLRANGIDTGVRNRRAGMVDVREIKK